MPPPNERFQVRDGWRLEIIPLTLGRARIIHTDGKTTVDVFWCFPSPMAARIALAIFESSAQLEPEGWHRTNYNAPDGQFRRRLDGLAETEFEAP